MGKRRHLLTRKDKSTLLKPGEIARRVGLSRQAIHIYTTMGLIKEARRTPSGHRLYSKDVLKLIALIRELAETGYTLRDIKEIFIKEGRI